VNDEEPQPMAEKRRLPDQSDALLREVDAVRELERRKRTMEISTPEFHQTAAEITERGRRVFRIAADEDATGQEAPSEGDSIDDVAAGRRDGEST
jgi:hypothetical protein